MSLASCFRVLALCLLLALLCPVSSLSAKPKTDPPQEQVSTLTSLFFSGQRQKAIELLRALEEKKSKGLWKGRFQFLAGYLNLQAGKYREAAERFGKIDPEKFPIPDYVDFYRAISLRDAGAASEAVNLLQKLQGSQLSPYLSRRIDRELALAYCNAKDRGKAIDRMNALIQNESYEIKTYHLRFDRAQCLIELGDTEEAYVHLRQLYLHYPEGDLSVSILEAIRKLHPEAPLTAADHLARADQLLARARPDLAALDLEAAAELHASPSLEFKQKLAETYFKGRRYGQAAQLWEEIRRSNPGTLTEEDLENLAKAYSRSDQFDRAIAVYRELLGPGGDAGSELSPAGDKTASYLFKIGFLTMDKGDYSGAIRQFEELLERFPSHPQREQIEWYLAWNHYLLKHWEESLRYLDRLTGASPLPPQGRNYWRARIYEKQGRTREAQEADQAVREEDPISYYGLLSAKRLENQFAPEKPPTGGASSLPRQKIPAPFYLKPPDSASKTGANRLKELLLVGLWEDFLGELAFVAGKEGLPSDLSDLNAGISSPSGRVAEESGDWGTRFPPAYSTLVSLFSSSRQIQPALTWAIMREESRFRSEALSPAGAIGLMQIIPPTGFEIAADLGRNGFTPDDLYNPVVNIEYGAHYLAKNLGRFQNNLIHTIASYNAGPEAVERWTRSRPEREWDEFAEEIPYKETNQYVKKVLRSYYIYRLMYQD